MPVDPAIPFIGRPELLRALTERRAEARAGRGGVSLLEGEAGVGKSVLLAEILRDARTQGFRILDARAAFSDDPPPFRVLRDAFRAAKLPLLPELEAPEPGSGSTSETRLMEALRRTTEEGNTAPQSAFVSLADRLGELAREQPTLLAIENAGHADALSLDFVAFLAQSLERVPLW
ncbi:MAG: ATP-binding protein, partial [Thermoplasmata archaeon]|nr:ATP-binding protein [Thermoplasmata archaeon]